MKKALLIAALAAGAISTSQAGIIYQTNTQKVTSRGTTFNFNQFDSNLGTLNSVIFSIVSSTDSGAFSVQNTSSQDGKVKLSRDTLIVTDNQGNNADYSGNNAYYTTSPSSSGAGYTIAAGASEVFAITDKSLISGTAVVTDLSAFTSLYTGSGNVSFLANIAPSVTITSDSGSFSMADIANYTQLDLTYDYTITAAVPEPSQVAASLLLMAGIAGFLIVRRRQALVA
jgi:hypothetical protein